MDSIKAPTAKDDCRDLWKVVAKHTTYLNALGTKLRIIYDQQGVTDGLQLTEGNATLTIKSSPGGTAAALRTPWQPYQAPFTGSGATPADQGLQMMIRPGDVSDGLNIWQPGNPNRIITVPANCTVGYNVWLDATISADAKITALDYGSGTDLPAAEDTVFDDTGTPPPHAYCLLFVVTSTATGVEYGSVDQRQSTSLTCQPTLVKALVNGIERRMFFYSAAPTTQS